MTSKEMIKKVDEIYERMVHGNKYGTFNRLIRNSLYEALTYGYMRGKKEGGER